MVVKDVKAMGTAVFATAAASASLGESEVLSLDAARLEMYGIGKPYNNQKARDDGTYVVHRHTRPSHEAEGPNRPTITTIRGPTIADQ